MYGEFEIRVFANKRLEMNSLNNNEMGLIWWFGIPLRFREVLKNMKNDVYWNAAFTEFHVTHA